MKIIEGVLLLVFLIAFIGAPFAVFDFKENLESILNASDYKKVKVKVDSMSTYTPRSSDGAMSYTLYTIYNFEHSLEVTLSDAENVVFGGRDKEEKLVSHMLNYMDRHGDSVWVWYHSEAPTLYAKPSEHSFPIKASILDLVWNTIVMVTAIVGIFYITQRIRKARDLRKTRS